MALAGPVLWPRASGTLCAAVEPTPTVTVEGPGLGVNPTLDLQG